MTDNYEAAFIGVSAGGLQALRTLLTAIAPSFPLPIVIVQHLKEGSDSYLADYLNGVAAIQVKEADDKEKLKAGVAYIAPAGYHLLVEDDRTLALSVDPPVQYSRPSVDVLFESAVYALGGRCIGVVLTGANADGSRGLLAIKRAGGLAIVQNPATAEYSTMPAAALRLVEADYVVELEAIGLLLNEIAASCS
ncbi:chemotaxis protein CheB [Paenibacillus sp. YYML68]|uniref:chemotaxis protein CheB n=1 Tax=Paenibacillus sp. YYML68 TaxID=2909250 RepID=UPI0024907CDE|nr:chemotaxis protein CheB [Paenibacillus sp. YYML68]